MKVFLTGLTGYIGHELALKLARDGFKINGLVRDTGSKRIPDHPNIKVLKGDICDYDSVLEAISGCRYAFHTAAFTNMKCSNVKEFYCTNVKGTQNVLEASMRAGVEKVIHTSSLSVFGRAIQGIPITENQPRVNTYSNDYELTKSISEEVVCDYVARGLHCVILNLTRVYGPGLNTFSNGVNNLIQRILRGKRLLVPNKLNARANYVFIDDVINAQVNALKYGRSGERYIVGGVNVNYNELFDIITNVANKPKKIISVNYGFMKNGIGSLEFLNRIIGNEPPINRKILSSLFTDKPASSKKAIIELAHTITPLELGISKTVQHLNSQ